MKKIYNENKTYTVDELNAILNNIEKEKLSCIQKQNYSLAVELRDTQQKIEEKIRSICKSVN